MLDNSKSILAKLLASENINVEHRKTQTAYFDLKNRTLVCPIWKDMTSELYDLLMGHEVGHALNTPEQGWHNAIVKHKDARRFKAYLNILEDARIEKKMKLRYPGLKPSFFKAYQKLYNDDFFGILGMPYDKLPLIDRINLHFKLGPFMNVKFSEKEAVFIPRIEELETWEEVEVLAEELYAKALEDSLTNRMAKFDSEGENDPDEDLEEGDWSTAEYEEFDEDDSVESITDKAFREKESELLSEKSLPYVYVNLPKANLENIVVPHKSIHSYLSSYFSESMYAEELKELVYKKFLDSNKKIISYLVKEFELRKNARQFSRASVAKTGELDIKRVFGYKYNDDLFKRMTIIPKGKSHGMIMNIDLSGSMSDSIRETIEQTIILATFCRKVGIPFRVFGFSDNDVSHKMFLPTRNVPYYEQLNPLKFSKNIKDYVTIDTNFHLKEYLSSSMSNLEYMTALKNWLLLAECYVHRSNRFKDLIKDVEKRYIAQDSLCIPESEELKNTPLNEAIIASIGIVEQFRNNFKLDIVNTIFLTDGESNCSKSFITEERKIKSYSWINDNTDVNIIIKDPVTNKSTHVPPGVAITQGFLALLKTITNTKTLGFFIVNRSVKRQIEYSSKRLGVQVDEKAVRTFNKQKFLNVKTLGYNEHYFIPGGESLSTKSTDEENEFDTAVNKREIKSAFLKMQQSKLINRVLLSRFIAEIS